MDEQFRNSSTSIDVFSRIESRAKLWDMRTPLPTAYGISHGQESSKNSALSLHQIFERG